VSFCRGSHFPYGDKPSDDEEVESVEDSDTRSVKVTVLEENNKDEDGYSDVSQEFSDDELEEKPGVMD